MVIRIIYFQDLEKHGSVDCAENALVMLPCRRHTVTSRRCNAQGNDGAPGIAGIGGDS